ncbi:MAG: malto-oligosyltrehalose synthase [Oscillatoriales cyanobacterium RM1_1_9]|nr:malto-oligosyltrehalose synthase [Oscillatoriales cyanobacterium SM2_3_0]NJO47322.1 malto-oligosyltrehalose synthase [Oscillatoriales cyanobacterium RM2_1_1]NJO71853.1 malto-oligosyltrehalose synthase [Oscillatoriales cyanobacterium RM1_1_9]
MRIPSATYRIQFTPEFGFEDTQRIIPYLHELGISDLYASPIFKARKASTHGYDVVDPNQLNPELGNPEEFEKLIDILQHRNMGWVQDIVPNHMAYDSQNNFLMDILEYGPDSECFDFFDIDWEYAYEDIRGRVLTPLLGDFYGRCLENGELQLSYDEEGLNIKYYGLKIHLRVESYAQFISHDLSSLSRRLGRRHPDVVKLLGVLYILKNIPAETSSQQRRDQALFVKGLLWELYRDNQEIREFIDQNVKHFNGEVGYPESFNLLDDLLSNQFFRLSFWKVGAEELNYRRFFTINELICIRVEDLKVFQRTHAMIEKLIKSGKFTGLRIDHIDGLYNPVNYLHRLRDKVGDIYIVVEKILEPDEELCPKWPIQGTSGYEFLNYVNGLFCQKSNERRFNQVYRDVIGFMPPYSQLAVDNKRLIADKNLAGDADNLAHLLKRIAGQYRYGRDFTLLGLKTAIMEVLVRFPVYRTYIDEQGVSKDDRIYVKRAIREARGKLPELQNELDLIEKFLLLDYDDFLSEESQQLWLHFVMKFQQFSSPLTAKGIEDTLFYVYNRFLALNEVGGSPDHFGIDLDKFHQFNQDRLKNWPHAMSASSTHDTKRSEEIRARLNVISEIPDEWEANIRNWIELNRSRKLDEERQSIPDGNDEYFLYQTLVGAYPFFEEEYPQFIQRIKQYVIKAIREAKVHTAWLRPDTSYEEGFVEFIDQILELSEENEFLKSFRPFQQKIAFYGIFNSLSQTLLKMTCPGLPDFYQGTELWDLSLVDPDNRRPVDFQQRLSFLQEIKRRCRTGMGNLIEELMATWEDGRLKLFLISRVLEIRKKYPDIFQKGHYQPLNLVGKYKNHVLAFARNHGDSIAITIAPRFLTHVTQFNVFPLGEEIWEDTAVEIPSQFVNQSWQDSIVDQAIPGSSQLLVGQVLQNFPVALLINQEQSDLLS